MLVQPPDGWRETALFTIVVLALAFAATCAEGCGGDRKRAQTALDATARAVVRVDQSFSTRYSSAADVALEASSTIDEYRLRMESWDRGVVALRATRDALLAAQLAVDAWDQRESDARAALGCLADSVQMLVDVLRDLGVPLPDAVLSVLGLADTMLGACPAPAEGASP